LGLGLGFLETILGLVVKQHVSRRAELVDRLILEAKQVQALAIRNTAEAMEELDNLRVLLEAVEVHLPELHQMVQMVSGQVATAAAQVARHQQAEAMVETADTTRPRTR